MTKSKDPTRLDANESAFFKRQLEHIKRRTYDTKYKQLKAFTLLPISTEASTGAEEITYRVYSGIGYAKIIADYAHDFPRVDIFGEEFTSKVKGIGDSYGYSIQEIRRSQMTGVNLDQKRAKTARRASDEKVNDIAWNGDSDYGLQGFIDFPGTTEYTVPADGTGSSKEWSTKTPDQLVRDMAGIVTAVVSPTNGREAPSTMIMPIDQYMILVNTRMTDGNDKTVLTYFLQNNPFIKQIDWVVELAGAGAGGTDRFMVYTKDEDHLTLEIPQPFEQFPAQQRAMTFEIPCHTRCGGVLVYYPLAVAYGDGI